MTYHKPKLRPRLRFDSFQGLYCPQHGYHNCHMVEQANPVCWQCEIEYPEAHKGCGGEVWEGKCHRCEKKVQR
jgi:hypothetical protein